MKPLSAATVRVPSDPVKLAYLAGLIDGEGCIGIAATFDKRSSRSRAYFGRLYVSNTDIRLMAWLQEHCGGRVNAMPRKSQPTWKTGYKWELQGANAELVLRATLPYLVLKRRQAETLLELRELQAVLVTRTPSADQAARKEALKQRIHLLNRKGAAPAA